MQFSINFFFFFLFFRDRKEKWTLDDLENKIQ
jgi:hypothetical protein